MVRPVSASRHITYCPETLILSRDAIRPGDEGRISLPEFPVQRTADPRRATILKSPPRRRSRSSLVPEFLASQHWAGWWPSPRNFNGRRRLSRIVCGSSTFDQADGKNHQESGGAGFHMRPNPTGNRHRTSKHQIECIMQSQILSALRRNGIDSPCPSRFPTITRGCIPLTCRELIAGTKPTMDVGCGLIRTSRRETNTDCCRQR